MTRSLVALAVLAFASVAYAETSFGCSVSGATVTTECRALVTGQEILVSDVVLSNGPTAQTLQLVYGTGANCVTGQTVLTSTVYLGVNGVATLTLRERIRVPAGQALCCKPSGATAFSCHLRGVIR